MRMRLFCLSALVLALGVTASASIIPIGSYQLTFSRTGWSETKTIPVMPFPQPAAFYQVGEQDVNVYLHPVANPEPNIYAFTWYVNAPAALTDPSATLLGGSGPLTITVSGLKFQDVSDDVIFQPDVTHIYYVGYSNGYYVKQFVPGYTDVDPGTNQWQRSPIRPLQPGDPDYAAYGSSYGTPYEVTTSPDVTFVLPDLYVPNGANWELSFGAGFTVTETPEPISLAVLGLGSLAMGLKRKF